MKFFSCNALKCISINNPEGKIISDILNINSNETWFNCLIDFILLIIMCLVLLGLSVVNFITKDID